MRNLKRFLALALSVLMVVACFSVTTSAKKFDDVTDNAIAIDTLSDLEVIKGRDENTFDPDALVTREEMALLIAKLFTGKVSDESYALYWNTEVNETKFTDLVNYFGAVNYASNLGIIVGTSDTTFEPTANITYQDALTMVVRALGYGSKTMNAGYPWTYIREAEKDLGISLPGVAYTQEITRAETAQILYSAFYAKLADSPKGQVKTLATDLYNLKNVIVVADNNATITTAAKAAKKNYIGIAEMLADGTISATTYYVSAEKFGAYTLGDSYRVATADEFKTLGVVVACDKVAFTAADITVNKDATANFTLFGVDYKAVDAITEYSTAATANVEIPNQAYFYDARVSATAKVTNVYALVNPNNAYASGFAYDDDCDGLYERVIYKYQSFGKVTFEDTNADGTADTYKVGGYAITSSDVEYATGEYVRYDIDVFTKATHVYEVYNTWQSGYVTGVTDGKIVVEGTTYAIGGVDGLNGGASALTAQDLAKLVSKNVKFLVIDGKIFEVEGLAASTVVFDNLTGITTAGYATALTYVVNPADKFSAKVNATNITIATIDGYSFTQYVLKAMDGSLKVVYDAIYPGTVFAGEKDALGYWHLTTICVADLTSNAIADTIKADGDDLVLSISNDGKYDFTQYVGKYEGSVDEKTYNVDNFYFVVNADLDAYTDPDNSTPDPDEKLKASCKALNDTYDAIIYVDNRVVASLTTGGTDGLGNNVVGGTYTYSAKALDMVSGNMVTIPTLYNLQLEAGKFYTMTAGYIEEVADESLIDLAILTYSRCNTTKFDVNGSELVVPQTASKYYMLDANGNVELNADGTAKNYAKALKDDKGNVTDGAAYAPVYYYTGASDYSMSQVVLGNAITVNEVALETGITLAKAAELGLDDLVVGDVYATGLVKIVIDEENGTATKYTYTLKVVEEETEDEEEAGEAEEKSEVDSEAIEDMFEDELEEEGVVVEAEEAEEAEESEEEPAEEPVEEPAETEAE